MTRMGWVLLGILAGVAGFGLWTRFGTSILQGVGDFLVVNDHLRTVDVIISITGDGTGERVRTAAALVQAGWAPWLMISGSTRGVGRGGATAAMLRDALQAGIPRARIEVDDQALSTSDNARNTAQVMRRRGWRTAILVTSPYHTRRAAWAFRREFHRWGLDVRVVPAERSFFNVRGWWRRHVDRWVVIHEYQKLLAYVVGLR